MSRTDPYKCPGSVSGHDSGGTTDGSCTWCGKKGVGRPAEKPRVTPPTKADQEYRRHYDPDYGTGDKDT